MSGPLDRGGSHPAPPCGAPGAPPRRAPGAPPREAPGARRPAGGGPPRGTLWRLTAPITARSRGTRYRTFVTAMGPGPDDRVLDVGAGDSSERSGNFLESSYPWPERITAVAPGPVPGFRRRFPEVTVVEADGLALPFADASFEIGFSNAVVEHVGGRERQRRFVAEMLRTCGRVFVATPDRRFPVDPHTLLPLVHWLPARPRGALLRLLGQGRWASPEMLDPLDARSFVALFPAESRPRLLRQRLLGLSSVLIVVAEGTPPVRPPSTA